MTVGIAGRCHRCSMPSGTAGACRTGPTVPTSAGDRPAQPPDVPERSWRRSGSRRCPTSRRGSPCRPAGPGRRPRLRSRLVALALGRAYPGAQVDGIDVDPPSVEEARRNATEAGVGDRVRFTLGDASDPALTGRYDLVTMFETLHDMAHPVEALHAGTTGDAGRRRCRPRRRRAGGEVVHRARGRARAVHLRLERPPLPASRAGRTGFGRHRHGDPAGDGAPLRERGRLARSPSSPSSTTSGGSTDWTHDLGGAMVSGPDAAKTLVTHWGIPRRATPSPVAAGPPRARHSDVPARRGRR